MSQREGRSRGGYPRSLPRWRTDFGRWVSDFGVSHIVERLAANPDLRVTNGAVYQWLRGRAPHPLRAMALVEMSEGRLTLETIYRHREELQSGPPEREPAKRDRSQ